MEFHAVQDTYTFSGRKATGLPVDEFYRNAIESHEKRFPLVKNAWDAIRNEDCGLRNDLSVEWQWWINGRPYYNVWPAMIGILEKFDCTKVPYRSFVDVPDPTIVLRFPVGYEYRNAMCLSVSVVSSENGKGFAVLFCAQRKDMFTIGCFGKEYKTQSSILYFGKESLDAAFGSITHREEYCGDEAVLNTKPFQKFGLAVLLMERDSQIFEPDILAKDSVKYASADDEGKKRLEEKAFRRRGQRGYHIGRKLESIPHFRRPHPALFWTGKGRSTARVVMRSGCVVNRQQMTKAPTGFMGAFGEAETDKEV